MMSKELTKKWKDGELGFGYYYIDFGIGGVPMLFNGLEFYCERTQKPNAIKTILAPVPSYDEYKELVRKIDESDEELKSLACKNDTLAMENGKLQEQLKEANEVIKTTNKLSGNVDLSPLPYQDRRIVDGISMETDEYLEKWGVE